MALGIETLSVTHGEPNGSLGGGEAVSHTDMPYLDLPPRASLLYSVDVLPTGGNT
ncbi:MAG: TauD/TfdA family dioxygenase [Alphaproteobacteria bacterium]|nr:TauD/TfdA family dioxygenase [Alphaproteobacteria bacterium]